MDRIPHSQGSPIGAACIPAEGGCPATCSPPAPCHIEGLQLVVAPFRVLRRRQAYLSRSEIRIDLAAILPGTYRVLAVHNFHVEDCNPCLDECLAVAGLSALELAGAIEQLRAQTRAVDRGDSIIKVDGAGLQPHLEAFMWEILKTIQVRVNQDGLAMLLGV